MTGHFEFYHLQSGWDGKSDPRQIPIPAHRADGSIEVLPETGVVFVLIPGDTTTLARKTKRGHDEPDRPRRVEHGVSRDFSAPPVDVVCRRSTSLRTASPTEPTPEGNRPMQHYLLSVHSSADAPCAPRPPNQMQSMMQRIGALEGEMRSEGAWVASGKLTDPDSATVVRETDGDILTTDGPFAEAKEHIAGFYIIKAPDLDAALRWAGKVTSCVGQPIEVRAFAGYQT